MQDYRVCASDFEVMELGHEFTLFVHIMLQWLNKQSSAAGEGSGDSPNDGRGNCGAADDI